MKRRKIGLFYKTGLQAVALQSIVLSAGVSLAEVQVNHVREVRVQAAHEGPQGTEIAIMGSAAPVFNVRVEGDGKRLIVDLTNADIAGAPEAITSPVGLVGGVLTQSFATEQGTMTRLSVSLAKPAAYRVRPEGTTLKVMLSPSATTQAVSSVEAAAVAKVAAAVRALPAEVSMVRVESADHGADCVRIATSVVPAYALGVSAEGRPRLELRNTSISEALRTTQTLSPSSLALRHVTMFYDAAKHATVIEVDGPAAGQGTIAVEGSTMTWSFDPPAAAARPAPAAAERLPGRKSVTVAREKIGDQGPKIETSIRGEGAKVEIVSTAEAAGFATSVNAQATGQFGGKRINLDFKDADIHNILRLLADVGRVNVVTADDVSGTITIRMNNVPWDQALDVVLQAKGLGMARTGNLIRVAPLATLQKERELRIAAAKQELELAPLETRLVPVSYARAAELQARAQDLKSPRGSLAVDERTNFIIARDVAANLNNIEELVRSLDTQTPQILVEARIVEASSRYSREMGIQWGGDATFSEAAGNPTGLAFPSRVGIAGGATDGQTNSRGLSATTPTVAQPNFAVNLPAAAGTGAGGAIGFSLGSLDNNFNVALRLSAAEQSGLVRIVSSPRVLTLDNKRASISQGTLIPFSQVSAQGVQTTFQEAKLQLEVTPHVTADSSISMHVRINRDEPDFANTSARGDPTILKREAETDLLVMDGHTAVIGGIYTRNESRGINQVPFFGDIPILGVLFQKRTGFDNRGELMMFLTPRIVNRPQALRQ